MSPPLDDVPRAGRLAPSLLGRVFLRMSLTMFAAIGLVVAVLYLEFIGHMDTLRDRSLSGQAADVARHMASDDAGGIRVDLPPALEAAYARSGRYRYVVLGPGGDVLAASPGVSGPLDATFDGGGRATGAFATLDSQTGRSFFGTSEVHQGPAGQVIIQVQQSAEHEDVLMDTFLDELGDEVLWIVVLVFSAILLVTWFTLRASLSSLEEVSRQAAAIGPDTLHQRLSLGDVPAEVRPMVNAVNAALDRVEHAFREQRRFTADAAHELRTPIAVLRAHLDILEPGQAQALTLDLTALDRVVTQLLRLAQADSMSLETGGVADLHQVALNVAALMGPAAIREGRSIALTGDASCTVSGDVDALEMALRNLVENALNHTPPGSEVEIEVKEQSRSICVGDRGPGVPPAQREQIFQRFWRGNRRDASGAGLGLSIVARVAAAHGATLSVGDRDGGGALFCMTFPPQQSPIT